MKRSVESLQKEVEELKDKCKKLEDSRENLFQTDQEIIKGLREKIESQKKAVEQLQEASNSLIKWVAHVNGGEFKLPRRHMGLTKEWKYRVEEDIRTQEYVFTVEGD